jgi:hypothetical protein
MGQPAAYFGFTNISASACWVQGYPTVAFFDGAGHRIDAAQDRGRSYQIDDPGAARIGLAPQATGWFGVGWLADNAPPVNGCVNPAAVEVVPPIGGPAMRLPVHLRAGICPWGHLSVTAVGLRQSFPLADPEG